MYYMQVQSRHQSYFSTLEDKVAADNPVWPIAPFTDKLDLEQLGFKTTLFHREGRTPYAPYFFKKLYSHFFFKKIYFYLSLFSPVKYTDNLISIIISTLTEEEFV